MSATYSLVTNVSVTAGLITWYLSAVATAALFSVQDGVRNTSEIPVPQIAARVIARAAVIFFFFMVLNSQARLRQHY
jgi:hypothetical protein